MTIKGTDREPTIHLWQGAKSDTRNLAKLFFSKSQVLSYFLTLNRFNQPTGSLIKDYELIFCF